MRIRNVSVHARLPSRRGGRISPAIVLVQVVSSSSLFVVVAIPLGPENAPPATHCSCRAGNHHSRASLLSYIFERAVGSSCHSKLQSSLPAHPPERGDVQQVRRSLWLCAPRRSVERDPRENDSHLSCSPRFPSVLPSQCFGSDPVSPLQPTGRPKLRQFCTKVSLTPFCSPQRSQNY